MPYVSDVTVQQLIDQIKVESRIKGADNLDLTALALINEYLLSNTMGSRYAKDLVVNLAVPVPANADDTFDLPPDYANIRNVYYARAAETNRGRMLRPRSDYIEYARDGAEPKWFEITADSLVVSPGNGTLTTDRISIDYYKLPTALTVDDNFPNPRLLPVIKQQVIARLQIFNKDFNAADRFTQAASGQADRQMTQEDSLDT